MSAVIDTPLGRATVTDGEWSAENKKLEDFLKLVVNPAEIGYSPNLDLQAAMTAINELPGSKLLAYDKVESTPGVIY